jgi:hypothetical protein
MRVATGDLCLPSREAIDRDVPAASDVDKIVAGTVVA